MVDDARYKIARALHPDLFNDDWGIAAKEAHPFSVPEAREEAMEDIDKFLAVLSDVGLDYETGRRDAVPEGWKLVPTEPDENMSIAGQLVAPGIGGCPPHWQSVYRAMIDAAPNPPEVSSE